MTKIKNYVNDSEVKGPDKWIATEDDSGLTKNISANKLAAYYQSAGFFLNPLSVNFKFLNFTGTRVIGTFSLDVGTGPSVPVSSLSSLVFSYYDENSVNISTFFQDIADSVIVLTKNGAVSDYGVFRVLSIEPHISEANFFSVSLQYLSGTGNVIDGYSYSVSVILKGVYVKLSDIGVDGRAFLFDFVAGENINAGDICDYGADLKMYKADATNTSKSSSILAIAMENVLIDETASFATWGIINTTGLIARSRYHLSQTPGGIQVPELSGIEDAVTRCIGFAINETTLMFNPSNDFIINKNI